MKHLVFLVMVFMLVSVLAAGSEEPNETGDWRQVERVVDGDTLILDGGERVRLIGVDTPETVHPNKPVERFGKEASAFTRGLVEGERVRLAFEEGGSTKDRYGRTLGYIYLEDGRLLNLEIIEKGYGHAYTRFPFSRMEAFRDAERAARDASLGLWADEEADPDENPLEEAAPPQLPPRLTTPRARPLESGVGESTTLGQSEPPSDCIPRSQCCKVCSKGKACGNSCIRATYTCRKGRGCACDSYEVCR